jgi:hypothetical protein
MPAIRDLPYIVVLVIGGTLWYADHSTLAELLADTRTALRIEQRRADDLEVQLAEASVQLAN